jgi:glucoamylase
VVQHADILTRSCFCADFQPCNSYSLATLKVVVDAFRDIYPINNGIPTGKPLAIGRYPEDNYFGGNPWYLCTLAVAEFLYDAVAQFKKAGSLTIDEIDLAFFKDIYPNAATGTYKGGKFRDVLDGMTNYADGFVSIVQVYSILTDRIPPAN